MDKLTSEDISLLRRELDKLTPLTSLFVLAKYERFLDDVVRVLPALLATAERVFQLEAKLDVLGGDWCAQNRSEGRGPCGACAWCCKAVTDRAERAEIRAKRAEDNYAAADAQITRLSGVLEKARGAFSAFSGVLAQYRYGAGLVHVDDMNDIAHDSSKCPRCAWEQEVTSGSINESFLTLMGILEGAFGVQGIKKYRDFESAGISAGADRDYVYCGGLPISKSRINEYDPTFLCCCGLCQAIAWHLSLQQESGDPCV